MLLKQSCVYPESVWVSKNAKKLLARKTLNTFNIFNDSQAILVIKKKKERRITVSVFFLTQNFLEEKDVPS